MAPFLVALVLLAGKVDPKLAGTWSMAGAPFMTLNANGTGVMDGEKVTWSTQGTTLVVGDAEGGEDRATYVLAGDQLTLTLNGVPLQLVRAGKGEALKPKGRLAKKAEAAEGAESDAEALAQAQQWLQNQPAPSTPAPPPPAAKAPKAAAPVKAGTDQLSQLLLSSNWCYLRYASGNTYTQKVHFSANGTWSDLSESDIHVNNSIGIAEATSDRQSGGQWVVRGGQLLMSNPPETPQLTPLPLTITRNSNGYPILNSNGREYSQCQ